MGRERSRRVEHVFLYFTCGMIMLTSILSCSHYEHYASQMQARACLSRAEKYAAEGDYQLALKKNEQASKQYPGILADQRLYQRGLFYVHPKNPDQSYPKAIVIFNRLRETFPRSRYNTAAETWIVTLEAIAQKEIAMEKLSSRTRMLEKKNKKQTVAISDLNGQFRKRQAKLDEQRKQLEALQNQISVLENQLEKLKKVDLGIEKKKRQTAPQ